jgi:VWFA-related protein
LKSFGLTAIAVTLSLVATARAQNRPADNPQEKTGDRAHFQVAVDTVYLNVVVTGWGGRFVPGLEADDFEILEDGVLQELSFFAPKVTPLTVLLLLDSSSSIRPSINGVKGAASSFVRQMWNGDKAMIAFFNESVQLGRDFTDDIDLLERIIDTMYPAGMTALYDSVILCLDRLSSVDGRRSLLVFSDGADSRPAAEGSDASPEDAIEAGKLSEVSIYTVGFEGQLAFGGRRGLNRGFLKQLAQETGGRSFFPTNLDELRGNFARIQRELHSQYRMAYVPDNANRDGSWHRIRVRVKGQPNLDVRTREGYYALPPAKPNTDL